MFIIYQYSLVCRMVLMIFFVFCILEKKYVYQYSQDCLYQYLNLKLKFEKMCLFYFFLYFVSHFGEKFDLL